MSEEPRETDPTLAGEGLPASGPGGGPRLGAGAGLDAGPAPVRRPRWRVLRGAWEVTRTLLVAFALYLLVRAFVVEAFKIPTSSMEATLLVGDFLLVNKAVYGAEIPGTELRLPALEEPGRGDVIVFHPPHDPIRNYVKRVVAVPGDVVEMRDAALFVNGAYREEPYVRREARGRDASSPAMLWQEDHLSPSAPRRGYRPTRDNWGPLVVPQDRFFVLGDNRDNSEDSRYWGFVRRDAIRGRPWVVYYSFRPSPSDGLAWIRSVRWARIGGLIE